MDKDRIDYIKKMRIALCKTDMVDTEGELKLEYLLIINILIIFLIDKYILKLKLNFHGQMNVILN